MKQSPQVFQQCLSLIPLLLLPVASFGEFDSSPLAGGVAHNTTEAVSRDFKSSTESTLSIDGSCTAQQDDSCEFDHDSWRVEEGEKEEEQEEEAEMEDADVNEEETETSSPLDKEYGQLLYEDTEIDSSWFGEPQIVPQRDSQVVQVIRESSVYMKQQQEQFGYSATACRNREAYCSIWAADGECDANPAYMKVQCASACRSCDYSRYESRCPVPDHADASNVWQPGDLDRWFTYLTTNGNMVEKYRPVIHSQPQSGLADEDATPWVVTLPQFLTPHECQTLIDLGRTLGYERSGNAGEFNEFDGTHELIVDHYRTSTNTWCTRDCYQNATTNGILAKLVQLTGIPGENSEDLQLLRYTAGQYYLEHHDYIGAHVKRPQGARIMTIFFYLNTLPESAGGGTDFPRLNITIQPVQGTALIWPSVLSDRPDEMDPATNHQALSVQSFPIQLEDLPSDVSQYPGHDLLDDQGRYVKYGANAWCVQDCSTHWSQHALKLHLSADSDRIPCFRYRFCCVSKDSSTGFQDSARQELCLTAYWKDGIEASLVSSIDLLTECITLSLPHQVLPD
jgi:2OG-Fe(II) oxygenase superfamily/ShK domain-like